MEVNGKETVCVPTRLMACLVLVEEARRVCSLGLGNACLSLSVSHRGVEDVEGVEGSSALVGITGWRGEEVGLSE